MSKARAIHETPPLRMRVEKNKHLSPVTQHDHERIDSYRIGDELWCSVSQDLNFKLVRKYWAILNEVIKSCPCPWNTTEQASSALKLAYNHCQPYKTITGQWRMQVKSLNDFKSEQEFEEFFEFAMAALERITGVDPLTLRSKSADTETPSGTSSRPEPDGQEAASKDVASSSTPSGITADSIITHMHRYADDLRAQSLVTRENVEENLETLDNTVRGYSEAFGKLNEADQERLRSAKKLIVHFLKLEEGFPWGSVDTRVRSLLSQKGAA